MSTGKLQFSNDAANWTDLGSGADPSGDSLWTFSGSAGAPVGQSQGTGVAVNKRLILFATDVDSGMANPARIEFAAGGKVAVNKPLDAPQLCIAGVCKTGWTTGGGGTGEAFWTATGGGSGGVGIVYGGNVGIGTNTLATGNTLTVQGNAKISGTITAANFLKSDGTPIGGGGGGTGGVGPWTKLAGSDVVHLATPADRVVVGGTAPYVGEGGRQYKMTVSGDAVFRGAVNYFVGGVGIGTETPRGLLDVKGDGAVYLEGRDVYLTPSATDGIVYIGRSDTLTSVSVAGNLNIHPLPESGTVLDYYYVYVETAPLIPAKSEYYPASPSFSWWKTEWPGLFAGLSNWESIRITGACRDNSMAIAECFDEGREYATTASAPDYAFDLAIVTETIGGLSPKYRLTYRKFKKQTKETTDTARFVGGNLTANNATFVGRMGIGTDRPVSTLHVKASASDKPATRGLTIQGFQDGFTSERAVRLFMHGTDFRILRSVSDVDDGLTIRSSGDVVAGRGLEVKDDLEVGGSLEVDGGVKLGSASVKVGASEKSGYLLGGIGRQYERVVTGGFGWACDGALGHTGGSPVISEHVGSNSDSDGCVCNAPFPKKVRTGFYTTVGAAAASRPFELVYCVAE